jgi:putative holliday junction resolvase
MRPADADVASWKQNVAVRGGGGHGCPSQLPVTYWDERFTTVQAEGHLVDAGLTRKRRKQRRDRVAAQILLQAFLDAGCPVAEMVRPLDDDS